MEHAPAGEVLQGGTERSGPTIMPGRAPWNPKGGKAFLQQSGYGVAGDCTPQSRAASPRSRLLRTSPASVSGSPKHRPSGADSRSPSAQEITFHICHPVKGRRPASLARKQRAEGCRTPTAEHCSASRTRHQPNLPGGEETDPRVTSNNLPLRYHNRAPGCQQPTPPGGTRQDGSV